MKLERVTEKKTPGYPSFKDHATKRSGLIKTVLGGMLAVLAAGCNVSAPNRTGGVMVVPNSPEEGAPDKAPSQPSPANVLPLEKPVALEGDIAFPTPPPAQEELPATTLGIMAPVKPPPPEANPEEPVRKRGEMMAPVPPTEPDRPVATGGMPPPPRPPAAEEEK